MESIEIAAKRREKSGFYAPFALFRGYSLLPMCRLCDALPSISFHVITRKPWRRRITIPVLESRPLVPIQAYSKPVKASRVIFISIHRSECLDWRLRRTRRLLILRRFIPSMASINLPSDGLAWFGGPTWRNWQTR